MDKIREILQRQLKNANAQEIEEQVKSKAWYEGYRAALNDVNTLCNQIAVPPQPQVSEQEDKSEQICEVFPEQDEVKEDAKK